MSSANPFSPLSPKSGLRYASCVGRVGALAVALGVGFAVASTPGVAHADGSTNPSQSTEGATTGSMDSKDATKAGSANDRRQSRVSERRQNLRALSVAASNPGRPARPIRSTTPIAKDNHPERPTVVTDTDGATVKSGDDATKSGDNATRGAAASGTRTRVTARKDLNRPAPPIVSVTRVHSDRSVAQSVPSTQSVISGSQPLVTASGQPSTSRRQYVTDTRTSVATFTRALPGTPTPTPAPVNAAASAPATFVSSVLAAVGFGPSVAPTRSPAPAPAPFAWAVMGFVRRELELIHRTFLNRTPIATNDTVPSAGGSPITEDGAFTFDPRANDVDPDKGDVLTITGVTNGQYGSVTTNGTSVTYTPNTEAQKLAAGDTVTDTFTYTVSDANSAPHIHGLAGLLSGGGHAATATVTVTLTGANDAPIAVNDAVAAPIDEDSPGTVINVLGNDTDVDRGDTKKVNSVTQGTLGKVTVNADGTVTYAPTDAADALAGGENRTDTFTYTMSDRSGATSTATVSVVVAGTNDAPVAGADTLDINENAGRTVVDVLGNDKDAEGDTLKVVRIAQDLNPHLGTASLADGVVTFTPNAAALGLDAGEVGTDSFTYTVEDGRGGTATGTVTVTVRGVDDAVVVSTGDSSPVDVEWWSAGAGAGYGYIRNLDGTLAKVSFDEETGWSVGTSVQFDAGAMTLDARTVYAYDRGDGSLALIDADTGAVVGRVVDRIGAKYDFGDVTDMALDSRADGGQADVVYTVDSSGALTAIDTATGVVVATADTRDAGGGAVEAFAAAADTTSSPRVAVAPGGSTVYVADGRRIAVVKRQTAIAARAADGESTAAATDLVYDRNLDLDVGGQVTAMEVSANGDRIYATVATVDASGAAASRLVAINVNEDGTLAVAGSVAVDRGARSLAVNDDLNRAYVVSDRTVSVVGLGNLDVVRRVDTGGAGAVTVVPNRDAILVTNPDSHAVSVISDAPITVALTWGAQPRDLDAHLIGPTGSGGTFHIYYANKTYSVAGQDGRQQVRAFLNVDDTDGDGPEIVQIDTRTPGVYQYFVVNYSGETSFAPGTVVTLRDPQSGLTQTVDLSQATGSGRYWSVFTVTVSDTGAVTVATDNTLSNINPDPNVPPPPGGQVSL